MPSTNNAIKNIKVVLGEATSSVASVDFQVTLLDGTCCPIEGFTITATAGTLTFKNSDGVTKATLTGI